MFSITTRLGVELKPQACVLVQTTNLSVQSKPQTSVFSPAQTTNNNQINLNLGVELKPQACPNHKSECLV